MSSIVIAGYALFCIIVFFLVNRLLRKKKTNVGEEQVPAVSKIEVSKVETEEKEIERKQESEISNVVELETGKQEEVKEEKALSTSMRRYFRLKNSSGVRGTSPFPGVNASTGSSDPMIGNAAAKSL